MSGKICYRNKTEVKILSIVIGIIYGVLACMMLVTDFMHQNEELLYNQLVLLAIFTVPLIAILIINRYRIVLDYDRREVAYTGYLTPTRVYAFDQLSVNRVVKSWIVVDYVFTAEGKRIFHLSEVDFVHQTRADVACLKIFFTGHSKRLFDMEKHIAEEGFDIVMYHYDLTEFIGRVFRDNMCPYLSIGYLKEKDQFAIEVHHTHLENGAIPKDDVIDSTECDFDMLERNILVLARKHLQQ